MAVKAAPLPVLRGMFDKQIGAMHSAHTLLHAERFPIKIKSKNQIHSLKRLHWDPVTPSDWPEHETPLKHSISSLPFTEGKGYEMSVGEKDGLIDTAAFNVDVCEHGAISGIMEGTRFICFNASDVQWEATSSNDMSGPFVRNNNLTSNDYRINAVVKKWMTMSRRHRCTDADQLMAADHDSDRYGDY